MTATTYKMSNAAADAYTAQNLGTYAASGGEIYYNPFVSTWSGTPTA